MLPQNSLPSRSTLRRFGFLMSASTAFFFGALLPWIWQRSAPVWVGLIVLVFALLALIAPAALGPVYKSWMKIGSILGRINSVVLLTVVYYGIVLPMGLIMRGLGKDPLTKKTDARLTTYRLPSLATPRQQLEKPF